MIQDTCLLRCTLGLLGGNDFVVGLAGYTFATANTIARMILNRQRQAARPIAPAAP
jgi:hypothetical protein